MQCDNCKKVDGCRQQEYIRLYPHVKCSHIVKTSKQATL